MKYLKTIKILVAILSVVLCAACSKNTMSERDIKLQQMKNTAEIKRKELLQISAVYKGIFSTSDGLSQPSKLSLEIKDVPSVIEGQVDPVMTPVLVGYLRLFFSESEQDFENFTIQKADFDVSKQKVDIVLIHEKYKDTFMTLNKKESELKGSWTMPSFSASGSIELKKVSN